MLAQVMPPAFPIYQLEVSSVKAHHQRFKEGISLHAKAMLQEMQYHPSGRKLVFKSRFILSVCSTNITQSLKWRLLSGSIDFALSFSVFATQ